jgi:hypothetical protein
MSTLEKNCWPLSLVVEAPDTTSQYFKHNSKSEMSAAADKASEEMVLMPCCAFEARLSISDR